MGGSVTVTVRPSGELQEVSDRPGGESQAVPPGLVFFHHSFAIELQKYDFL